MLAAALLAAAAAATSFLLPASPEAAAVGDIDGDNRSELVLLLVWPSWSSMAVNRSTDPSVYEVDVTPAIEDRRELWAFRFENGRLERIAEPLRVGREILALAPAHALGPVVALDDNGVSRVVLDRSDPAHATLRLDRLVAAPPVVAGSAVPLHGLPVLARMARGAPPSVVVPTGRGLTLVGPDGTRRDVDTPFRLISSGATGRAAMALPRWIDLDRDGLTDALFIDHGVLGETKIVFRRGQRDGGFAAPTVWDLGPLLKELAAPSSKADEAPPTPLLADVLDVDGDGVLEAAVLVERTDFSGLTGALKALRKAPGEILLYPLASDGTVAAKPSARIDIIGFPFVVDHPDGWATAFRDLDGDGRPELLTFTIDAGLLGIARVVVTKKVKVGIRLRVYRRTGSAWAEVEDAAPEFKISVDLSDFDTSRFFRVPGDVDGDGRTDIVQVNGREIDVLPGLPGARFASRPKSTIKLQDPIRSYFGLTFVDLDGDGRSELLAFEPQPPEKDRPSIPVLMEVHSIGAGQ